MKELDGIPAEERKTLEEGLKAQGVTLEEQVAKLAAIEAIQKQTAM